MINQEKMDNYNFTKGKWITENFDLRGYEKSILILSKNYNKQIAEVNFEYLKNNDYVYNALLISKAPEMFEMLERLRKYGADCGMPNVLYEDLSRLIKEATEL